ncbi:MAG TPA: DUF5715 family protein, partial [Pyrinomonadaceae bacterium]|nr:DUF5715 family protein [Pyrinomonadaceae bacterium]
IQVAEWREHSVETPHDYAGLARMIRAGGLVEVPAATESFLLYGVGALADAEPFTHFDKSAGKSVKIFDDAELASERARLEESVERMRAEIDSLKQESDALNKRERTRRASLRAEMAQREKALKAERERAELLDFFYRDDRRRGDLSAERDALNALALDFHGREYDLGDARARKEIKVRMLAHVRPEALAVMKELAGSYRERFGRPLPVTSLVRPDEYQHRLSRSNANATRIQTPPHSTGLAFDILYRHMTAEEQEHLMADIARLRDEGRVEALRENRDHFHIFVFVDGRRPGEELIAQSLGHSKEVKRVEESRRVEETAKREVKTERASAAKTRGSKKASREVAARASKPSTRKVAAKRSGGRATAR